MKYLILIGTLFLSFATVGQNLENWTTTLDYLNNQTEGSFTTEKNITGLCFVILADDFNYYKEPIVVKRTNDNEVLRITYTDSGELITTYKGTTYKQYDSSNTFKPWLFVDNPDYFRIAFECVDTVGAFYKVRLNEKEFTLIEKTNTNFKKESITNFVSGWTSLGFDFNRATNPVKKLPKENSRTIVNKDSRNIKSGEANV